MLLRVRKGKGRLPDGSAILTAEPRDIDGQFDLAPTDRKHFEDSGLLAEPHDPAGPAVRALQLSRLEAAVKNGLSAKKSTLLYCTPTTPNI